MASIVEAARFLGPENCAISIVEGRSTDGTYEVLLALLKPLDDMGVLVFFQKDDLDPSDDRIRKLGMLRNKALVPLTDPENKHKHFSSSSTVIFINDVALCVEDILELLHQRVYQSADMTCAMDWSFTGEGLTLFYDIWVARGYTGDTFVQIGEWGGWENAQYLFPDDPVAKSRFEASKSFQVFACWNGATAFTAAPIIEDKVKFRINIDGECFMGEPTLFGKDLWRTGYGKIAVVPSINLQYTDKDAKKIKKEKGYVHELIKHEDQGISPKVPWEKHPPKYIKCMP